VAVFLTKGRKEERKGVVPVLYRKRVEERGDGSKTIAPLPPAYDSNFQFNDRKRKVQSVNME